MPYADSPETPPAKRKRVTKACLVCAKSRRKCDGVQPVCGTCRQHCVDCGWSDVSNRRGPPKGYRRGNADPQSLLPKITKIRTQVEALYPAYGKFIVLRELETSLFGSILHGEESSSPENTTLREYSEDEGEDELYEEEERAPSALEEGTSSGLAFLSTSVRRAQKEIDASPVNGRSPAAARYDSWFHEIANSERHKRQVTGGSLRIKEVMTYVQDPEPAKVEFLLKIYWSSIHPHWPILYKPAFDAISIFNMAAHVPRGLLFAIYALAARLAPNVGSSLEAEKAAFTSMAYFHVAQEEVLSGRLQSDLTTCMTLFLLSLHYHGEGNQRQAWVLCGLASTMALDLGLHRLATQLPEEDHERRVRVFWNIYVYDKILAAEMGRPVTLRWLHCDQLRLSEEQPDEYETIFHPTSNQAVRLYTISIFNAAIDLFRIFERILSEVHSIPVKTAQSSPSSASRSTRERLVTDLDTDLENWQARLPAKCTYPTVDDRHPTRTRYITHAWYHVAIILLHRPLIPRLRSGPGFLGNVHHTKATDAANQLVDLLAQYAAGQEIDKLPPNDAYLIFTAAVIHCFNIGLDDELMREAARTRLEQCLEWLKSLAETWPAASSHKRLLDAFSQAASNTMSRTFTAPQSYTPSENGGTSTGSDTVHYHQPVPYNPQRHEISHGHMQRPHEHYVVPHEAPELFTLENLYWNHQLQTIEMNQIDEYYPQAPPEVAPSDGAVYHGVLRFLGPDGSS